MSKYERCVYRIKGERWCRNIATYTIYFWEHPTVCKKHAGLLALEGHRIKYVGKEKKSKE